MEAKKASLVFDILNEKGETINGLLANDKTIFEVPIYHRNYDWSVNECEKLFGDIIEANKQECVHFMDTIYLTKKSDNTYTIIDGQQRLTTIYILLKALYDSLKSESSDLREKIAKVMFKTEYIHEVESGVISNDTLKKGCKLKLRGKDDKDLKNLIRKKADETSNIYKNYDFFKKKIKDNIKDILDGIERLEVVEIILDESDKPQDIFKSTNSTGLPLSLGDLTKNYLLVNNISIDAYYDTYWKNIEENVSHDKLSDFVCCFLNFKNLLMTVHKKDVYPEFEKYCEESTKENVLKELLKVSKYYGAFFGTYTGYSEEINKCLIDLCAIEAEYILPFLFRVFNDYENEAIDEGTLCQVLKYLLTYFVRTKVCNTFYNISPLEFMVKMYNEAFKNDYNNYYHDFAAYLNDNKKYRMPNDETFRTALIKNNLYKKSANSTCVFLLLSIENSGKEKIKGERLEIEHFMPQNLTYAWKEHLGVDCWERVHKKYLHTLGNLTLTGYNGELGNMLPSIKKTKIQKKSKFTILNTDIVEAKNWNETTITERAEALSKKLIGLFQYDDKHHLPKAALENTSFKGAIGKVLSGCKVYEFYYNDNGDEKKDNDDEKTKFDKPITLKVLLEKAVKKAIELNEDGFKPLLGKDIFTDPVIYIHNNEEEKKKYKFNIEIGNTEPGKIYISYKPNLSTDNAVKFINDLLEKLKLTAKDAEKFRFLYSKDSSKSKINVFYNTKSKDESSSNIEVFTRTTPVNFIYKNKEEEKEVKVTTWPNLLKEFLNVVYELKESEIENLAVDNLSKTGKSLKIYKKGDKPAEAKQIRGSEYYYAIINKKTETEKNEIAKNIKSKTYAEVINELADTLNLVDNNDFKIYLKVKKEFDINDKDTWRDNTAASLFDEFFKELVYKSKITEDEILELKKGSDSKSERYLLKNTSKAAITENRKDGKIVKNSKVKYIYHETGIKFNDKTYYTFVDIRDEDKEAVIKWYNDHLKQEV